MATIIDFRELRRRERRRLRSTVEEEAASSTKSNDKSSTAEVTESDQNQPLLQNACDLTPYETLLPQNMLSEDNRIKSDAATIDSVFYAEQFLPSQRAHEISTWLQTIPDYAQATDNRKHIGLSEEEISLQHNGKWTHLTHARRRVALFDGTLPSYQLPPILQRLSNTLVTIGAFSSPPNHVLVNEYQPGEGIMPHTDGPAYESRTATISMGGSDVIFKLRPRQYFDGKNDTCASNNNQPKLEVVLHGNGSLIVFRDEAYLNHTHEIAEGVSEEITEPGICGNDDGGNPIIVKRGYRISLTFRSKRNDTLG